jgi:hypothetical protein
MPTTPTNSEDTRVAPQDDLLWGAQAIADFLGVPVDRIYYWLRIGRLPIAKLGSRTIVASRRKLLRMIDAAEREVERS